ncbi:MAG: altronate dehydratase [Ruminococcaceae bacterium]|nr:altronate dehydratase [Oscillospiraceae bacterium]
MKTLIINEKDNVAVSLEDGKIPKGHKFARRDIREGETVIKYGEIIGRATSDIKEGEWVHSHNVRSHLDEDVEYVYEPIDCKTGSGYDTFMGYRRPYGETGIRNEIYIIPTVGCVNQVCIKMCQQAQKLVSGTLDGIYTFTHQFGCSQLGEDNENIKKLLSAIALNPNAAFVLFVGLGCENNGLNGIKEYLAPFGRDNIEFFNCQDVEDELSYGLSIIERFAEKAKEYKREERPYSELRIGLKCGGSDGFSGITANPLVGIVSDRVIAAGGSTVLTEVPEMFGAEQILMNRCESAEVYEAYKKMIIDFKKYYTDRGFPVYENPSPGNKAGGITTLEEKSLGCIKKGGSTAVVDVLGYGDRVRKTGLSVLDAPGNDLIAATALAAAGCQIVLFTTGRGTPFSTFVPTMKISTNEALAGKKNGWIDFSAHSMDADGLYDLIKKTVNGEYICKSEYVREIAFYKTGVTL